MPSRSLYIFDADEAPSTYLTNYLITAICWFGVVSHFLLKPSKRAPPPSFSAYEMFPPATLLLLHQILFGVVMLIGGLGHQVFKYDKCPGLEMPANITVPCPAPPSPLAPATLLAVLEQDGAAPAGIPRHVHARGRGHAAVRLCGSE